VGVAVRLHAHQHLRAASAKQVLAVTPGFESPSALEEAPVALKGRSKVKARLTTGVHNCGTEIKRLKQHYHFDASRGLNSRISWSANSVVLQKGSCKAVQSSYLT
jgi:hypothetical protein